MSGTARIDLFDAIGAGFFGNGVKSADVIAAIGRAKGADELEIHIGSPGGDVWEGLSIYSNIRKFPGKKTTVVHGLAASIASIIALAGDRRTTVPSGMWMIHEPNVLALGNAEDMHEHGARLEQVRDMMSAIYSERTGMTREAALAAMTAETWYDAQAAKEHGFTHEIASAGAAPAMSASAVALLAKFQKAPASIVASARASTVPAAGSTLSATEREIIRMSGSTPEQLVALRGSQVAVELSAEERTRELAKIARFTGVPQR
jgi:ATP-dependent protease ClpP protease subunit